jgi:hypothetical protein
LWINICVGNSCPNIMKSPICRPTLLKPQITFSFFYLRFRFYRYESSASGRKMWKLKWHEFKLDHISYSDAFIFHSYAFQFMGSVIVKWYTFFICRSSVYVTVKYLFPFRFSGNRHFTVSFWNVNICHIFPVNRLWLITINIII